ncbi:hypothetical protein PMAYCL1PPCAC_30613, partial [Pristionchus mayeri]
KLRPKRGCGCTGPCSCSQGGSKYLPLFYKLHKGECGCKSKKPCGCPHGKPCGCNHHGPHPPCHSCGHNHGPHVPCHHGHH